MNTLRKLIVSGLGAGYLPASGTFGSLFPLAVFLAMAYAMPPAHTGPLGVSAINVVLAAVAVVASILCVALGPFAEKTYGCKDPGQCTVDEWAGQAMALLLLPISANPASWWWAGGTAFLAFRVFDILKPPPARAMEKLPQGWGVLLDDLVAGVYANIAAQLILRLIVKP